MEPNVLRQLLVDMLRIRLVEEKIAEYYAEQQMRCPVHLCIGQEAIAAGVCANLNRDELVMSAHRSHGHYLAKGGDLRAMLAELYGKQTGCCLGKGGSMHNIDLSVGFLGAVPIVGSTIPIAVGAAFGTVLQEQPRVTVIFFGEAATEEGVFHEAINFASLKKLPVVFVCENNLYSVYSPMEVRQPAHREVYQQAIGHGVEAFKGDGNDVVEVYNLAQKAIVKAREGRGPSFLELTTYRWREHCGPNYDNDIGYRAPSEFENWKLQCPIERFRPRMLQDGIVSESELRKINQQLLDEVEAAFRFAKDSPFPPPEALLENVYAS